MCELLGTAVTENAQVSHKMCETWHFQDGDICI